MDPTTIHTIAEMCGGKLLRGDSDRMVCHLSKDSRTLVPGDTYIALRGENFDGNFFLTDAESKGAVAAIVDNASAVPPTSKLAIILVPDSLAALQRLARRWREKISPKVVCITGSTGKTSTKEFTATVLASRYSVSRTHGSYNNHIGLPLTILETSSTHEVAVWEIGMNHPGEILPLAKLARPQIGIITNIGIAHIGYLGSRERIATEKENLIHQLTETLILSSEDDFSERFASHSPVRSLLVGIHSGIMTASDIQLHFEGTSFKANFSGQSVPVHLRVPGKHMVKNALFALAVGVELGIPLSEGASALGNVLPLGGRLRRVTHHGIHFLDDSYNANPESVIAALKTVGKIPCTGRRFAVLGRMGELGSYTEEGYRQVANVAKTSALDFLIAVGEEARPLIEEAEGIANTHHMTDIPATVEFLRNTTRPGDLVLIKGAKVQYLGRIIEQF